ncbi:MAG TPA: folylpolyglutamate synthase/dihydrofolate synthase family protein [Candidatus Deferrimicrobium sp.]|nr:folylpolyglutamate synthase/dihydrofolate synthase family protein [Candidatus Deferrimicrobium sp.]
MDYQEVLAYLGKIDEYKSMNLALANPAEIIRHFPFPLDHIFFIQVAGTNGKGSTAHFLASVLQSAGYKVGLFTSPHIHEVRERIKVDNRMISPGDFAYCIQEIKDLAEQLVQKRMITDTPTYFEYTFLASLYYFYREKVTVAILEAGLGGRLDATSTITPTLSVITNISHDHTSILGQRIKDIAAEKAGIIKKGVPVICACNVHSVAHAVIKNKARELNAPFYNVIDSQNHLSIEELDTGYRCRYITGSNRGGANYNFEVRMNGKHQTRNAATAVKAIQILETGGLALTPEAIHAGIKNTRVPARIEIIGNIILDGSHNVGSIKALSDFLVQKKKQRLTLIFGVLADKNYRQMTRLLLPFIENVIITEPISRRALPAEKLAALFNKWGVSNVLVQKDFKNALATAQKWHAEILVTGSFYLVGEIRHIIMHGG